MGSLRRMKRHDTGDFSLLPAMGTRSDMSAPHEPREEVGWTAAVEGTSTKTVAAELATRNVQFAQIGL